MYIHKYFCHHISVFSLRTKTGWLDWYCLVSWSRRAENQEGRRYKAFVHIRPHWRLLTLRTHFSMSIISKAGTWFLPYNVRYIEKYGFLSPYNAFICICKNWVVDSKNRYNLHIKRIDEEPNSFDELIVAVILLKRIFTKTCCFCCLTSQPAWYMSPGFIFLRWIFCIAIFFPAKKQRWFYTSYHTTLYNRIRVMLY